MTAGGPARRADGRRGRQVSRYWSRSLPPPPAAWAPPLSPFSAPEELAPDRPRRPGDGCAGPHHSRPTGLAPVPAGTQRRAHRRRRHLGAGRGAGPGGGRAAGSGYRRDGGTGRGVHPRAGRAWAAGAGWTSRRLALPWGTAAAALVTASAVDHARAGARRARGMSSSAMWRGLAVVVMGAGIVLLAVLPATSRLRVEHLRACRLGPVRKGAARPRRRPRRPQQRRGQAVDDGRAF